MERPHPRLAPMNLNVNMDVPAPSLSPTRASQFLRKITAVRIPMSMSRKTAKSNSGTNHTYPSVRQASVADARAGAKPYMSQPMLSLPGESDSPCEQNNDARSMSSGDDEHSPGTSQGKGSMDADGETNCAHLQARTQSMRGQMRLAAGQTHKKTLSAPLVPATTAPKIVVSPGQVPVPEKESGLEAGRNSDQADEKGKAVALLGVDSGVQRNSSASAHPIAMQPGVRRHLVARVESSSGASALHLSVAESHSHPPPRASSLPSSIRHAETSSSRQSFTSALTSPGQEGTHATSEQPPSAAITVPSPQNSFRPTSKAMFPSVSDIPPSPIIPAKEHFVSEPHLPTAFRPNAPISIPHFQSLPRPSTSNTLPPPLVTATSSLSRLPPSFVSIPGTPSARLSPAIITRQPPHPILTLPPISPQHTRARSSTVMIGSLGARTRDSAIPDAQRPGHGRGRSRSLRSMPALPREGPDDTRRDDHDDDEGSLEDLEEEDSDSDEEQDEERERIRVSESGRSDSAFGMSDIDHDIEDDGEIQVEQRRSDQRPWQIPMPELDVQTSPLDVSFIDRYVQHGTNTLAAHAQQAEDKTTRILDYFSSTAPTQESKPQTDKLPPRPRSKDNVNSTHPQASSSRPSTGRIAHTVPLPLIGTPSLSPRPSMYHHASRSMVDMVSMIKERDRNRELTPEIAARDPVGLGAVTPKSTHQGPAAPSVTSEHDGILGASLRRQHSMPTFGPSTEPPPYPAFPNRPSVVIQPRDEEGREPLPPYTNYIYLRTVMPRKMEFTAPGVQARDRKWRRTLCVLEGTAFRVYRCSKGAGGVGALSEWWERRVGVGDITEEPRTGTVRGPRARRSEGSTRDPARAERESAREQREREREAARAAKEEEGENGEQSAELHSPLRPPPAPTDAPQPIPVPSPVSSPLPTTKSKLLPSRFLHTSNASAGSSGTPSSPTRSRFLSDSSLRNTSATSTPVTGRRSLSGLRPSLTGGSGSNPNTPASANPSVISTRTQRGVVPSTSTSSTTEASNRPRRGPRRNACDRGDSNSSSLWREDADAPAPAPEDLVKGYSLNHAESGLGSDYYKRKNVIRVRVDGEQFLLQAPDVAAVVDWIEGFQAAANIALDLDVRPMPKGPMFPRRRRRRARRADGQATAGATSNPGAASSSAGDNSSHRH